MYDKMQKLLNEIEKDFTPKEKELDELITYHLNYLSNQLDNPALRSDAEKKTDKLLSYRDMLKQSTYLRKRLHDEHETFKRIIRQNNDVFDCPKCRKERRIRFLREEKVDRWILDVVKCTKCHTEFHNDIPSGLNDRIEWTELMVAITAEEEKKGNKPPAGLKGYLNQVQAGIKKSHEVIENLRKMEEMCHQAQKYSDDLYELVKKAKDDPAFLDELLITDPEPNATDDTAAVAEVVLRDKIPARETSELLEKQKKYLTRREREIIWALDEKIEIFESAEFKKRNPDLIKRAREMSRTFKKIKEEILAIMAFRMKHEEEKSRYPDLHLDEVIEKESYFSKIFKDADLFTAALHKEYVASNNELLNTLMRHDLGPE